MCDDKYSLCDTKGVNAEREHISAALHAVALVERRARAGKAQNPTFNEALTERFKRNLWREASNYI